MTRGQHLWLRSLVLAHHEQERRRRHPPALHAAYPGSIPRRLLLSGTDLAGLDAALRIDLWAALSVGARWAAGLRETRPGQSGPWLWLTREGGLDDAPETDAAWAGAARTAGAESGVVSPFVVIVRNGWRAPATGARCEWVRLRRPG